MRTANYLIVALSLFFLSANASAQSSKHAKFKNGVGSVFMGSVLPYNNDRGWKHMIRSGGELVLSKMQNWKAWNIRAIFKTSMAKIKQFKNKTSMIAMYVCSKDADGKDIVYWNGLRRESIDRDYAKRDSWGVHLDGKWLRGKRHRGFGKVYEQPKPIDCQNWKSFDLTDGGNLIPLSRKKSAFDRGEKTDSLNLITLKELVDAGGGKAQLTVYTVAFPYKKTTRVVTSTRKKLVRVKDKRGKVALVEEIENTGYKDVYVYGKSKLLARGKFTVVP